MSEYFGPNVTRTLIAEASFLSSIWQKRKPPLDSEYNLLQQLSNKGMQQIMRVNCPSGFLADPMHPQRDIITNPAWSNFFRLGSQQYPGQLMWAAVNGWLVPVASTRTGAPPGSANDADPTNVIVLDPPPTGSGQRRTDFVFLEVWQAVISPNPSTINKPSASGIYRYGNVESGASYVVDDMIDPGIGIETNARVQLQYRIRVVKDVLGLSANPDGFDALSVKAQGTAVTPTTFTFTNMGKTLGDPGLWRAGDGTQNTLGSVDGYSYAIPIAAIFRRNSVSWAGEPSPNLNGGLNRNPNQIDRSGILGQPTLSVFSVAASLSVTLTSTATTATVATTTNVALPSATTLVQIDDEILSYAGVSGTTLTSLNRGLNGTLAENHASGAVVRVLSSRPDGLFSDQIVPSDILDLRKCVSPSGFDYTALLESNLDKALRGKLRANWKRTDSGVQGVVLGYQDAIKSSGAALGVTQLDAPDNIRTTFSDAALVHPIEVILRPNTSVTSSFVNTSVSWSLGLSAGPTTQAAADTFQTGDVLSVPIAQLKSGLQAGSDDQVTWTDRVELQFEGENLPVPANQYTVSSITNPTSNLTITFSSNFPLTTSTAATPKNLHIRAYAIYGAGRGLSRRPDSIHSVNYLSPSSELLMEQRGIPSGNIASAVQPMALWSRFRDDVFAGRLPVTAPAYADLGSKTIVLTPFRRITFPDLVTIDGNGANTSPTQISGTSGRSGTASADNSPIINLTNTTLLSVGNAVVTSVGTYSIISIVLNTSITVDRPVQLKSGTSIPLSFYAAQGIMPLGHVDGMPKWATTDPLKLFCSTTQDAPTGNTAITRNIYATLPRQLVPGWGELHVPMMNSTSNSVFSYGYNFLTQSLVGTAHAASDHNWVSYAPRANVTYATFSTLDFSQVGNPPAAYNAAFTFSGNDFAGIRKFTDTRGMGRQGLELPPFYGVARLFAVYDATDFATNGSSVDAGTRAKLLSGGATNLLRQHMNPEDGPAFWIELDADGDSTFILNAKALKVANFAAGNYVVEASIFGFDRGSFDPNQEFRLVLTRPRTGDGNCWLTAGNGQSVLGATQRTQLVNKKVAGPVGVLPGPATISDQVLINYSRTAYQGDAWGTQSTNVDTSFKLGPMLSANAFALDTPLVIPSLSSVTEKKTLEVLASLSFQTTLGTGRISGDAVENFTDIRDVAHEVLAGSPPMVNGASDARPLLALGTFVTDAEVQTLVGSEYLGCTTRLPLGAWFRDKDFRGQDFGFGTPLAYSKRVGPGDMNAFMVGQGIGTGLSNAESGVGSAGDLLVHCDGEQSAYNNTSRFRSNRGGSVFVGEGPLAGGALTFSNESVQASTQAVNVLQGRAFLVRNTLTVTDLDFTERSAGGELMMLIVTHAQQVNSNSTVAGRGENGTNGQGEGYSAADLYRIAGHPLDRWVSHAPVDLTQVKLQPKA